MWSVLKIALLFATLQVSFAQELVVKKTKYLPTEWQLLFACTQKYPLLLRSPAFKQVINRLNEHLTHLNDEQYNFVLKGILYRYLLEVPPEESSAAKSLSAKEQEHIFQDALEKGSLPCPFFEWVAKSLLSDLKARKGRAEKVGLNDLYGQPELQQQLKTAPYIRPWALYFMRHTERQEGLAPVEAWEGYLLSVVRFLADQTSLLQNFSAESSTPEAVFEWAPAKAPTATAASQIDELFHKQ